MTALDPTLVDHALKLAEAEWGRARPAAAASPVPAIAEETAGLDRAWYVVQTRSRAEGDARDGLAWLGYQTFLPTLRREVRGRQPRTRIVREFPLFNRMALRYEKLRAAADVIAADNPCPDRPLIIIPSHLHWDHAGGIEDFPNAEVWIQDAELQQARTGGTAQGFLPAQIDAESIKWHPFTFSDQPYEQYRQSLDVFDDGSLILVPMAGHTAGSVGLFLTTARARYFFTGDTTWSREGFAKPAHKFAAARAIVDLDPSLLEKEIADVHQLMLRDPDLVVIPAHDAAAYPEGAFYPGWTDGQN